MNFPDDGRGQSVVIGSLLVFTILILSFSSYQAFVVPQENRGVEIDHSQSVQASMQEVRSAMIRASGGVEGSTAVPIGTTYPSRAIFLNPAPPSGTLETEAPKSVIVSNANGSGETHDYWDGTDNTYETRPLGYQPSYNEYRDPPVTEIEHTVLSNHYDEAVLPEGGQGLVDGRQIDLVVLAGDYQQSGTTTASLDPTATSPATETVPVADDGTAIEVTLETRIPESVWVELLSEEIDGADGTESSCAAVGTPISEDSGRFVQDCEYDDTVDPAKLTITLEKDVTYRLRAAKVGVGSNVQDPSPTYVVDVEGDGATIPDGGAQQVIAEVRDEYDNPVAGVGACAKVTDGMSLGSMSSTPATGETDGDGEVAFTFEAKDGADGEATVTVGYDCTGANPDTSLAARFATFDITVYDTGGGGGGTGNSPTVVIETISDVNFGGGGPDRYDVTATATDVDGDLREMKFEMKDTAGNVVDSTTVTVSGVTATEMQRLQASGNDKDSQYEIIVTATDVSGNSASDTQTQSGSG
jgi:hypothetical protein